MGRIIRADRRGPALIPAEVASAMHEAERVRRAALEEAQAIRARAYAAGLAEANARAAAELFDASLARARALADAEREVITLAGTIAEKLVHQAVAHDPQLIAGMVAPLLMRVRRARRIELAVHPDDAATLEQALEPMRKALTLTAEVAIVPSEQLSRGDCVVASDIGGLDARIDTQLRELVRNLEALVP